MTDSIGTWIGILGGIAGFLVLVTSLIILARGSYNKARIAALREDLDDARKREDDRKKEIDSLQQHQAITAGKLEGLIRENTVLKDLVTQRVEIGSLQSLLETQRDEIHSLKQLLESKEEADLQTWQTLLREELETLSGKIEGLLQRERKNNNAN